MKILVTGSAGFIGAHTANALLTRGDQVVGVDNFNDYYDVQLKRDRLAALTGQFGAAYRHETLDIAESEALRALLAAEQPDGIVHLAAQAGVRYSLENPQAYVASNLSGFVNLLEAVRATPCAHLVYASTSSVYGANTRMPYSVNHNVDHPVSLYAATKKSNELLAHTYSHLFGQPATGLRFFTVYGPWGRPDMSPFLFTSRILRGEPIDVFNNGHHKRDFTYVGDIVEGILRVLDRPASANPEWSGDDPDPATAAAPHRLYNIGSHRPVDLLDYIQTLERIIGRPANMNLLPMQPGDVLDTYADVTALVRDTGYQPDTPLDAGLTAFVDWYRSYYPDAS